VTAAVNRGHTVEKIGGTSMVNYEAVRDNIVLRHEGRADPYQRLFVVSAYSGVTNALLEHKKSGKPGVYSLFADAVAGDSWREALDGLRSALHDRNESLFVQGLLLARANRFIDQRLDDAERILGDLARLCQHGHFALSTHLETVREMLASIGEAHSAWNTAELLNRDGINAVFVDLTGWQCERHEPLDQRIRTALAGLDLATQLPIITGYCHCTEGLMTRFDRGYSEMTLSRLAVLSGAREAVIHKEYHLSSADPAVVGADNVVPIGRTNYDVADQLANLGMEAIHPRAAKGLRQAGIPLRIKNTFEPEHRGTLITPTYVSDAPCVEIIAGCSGVYLFEIFDQDMMGNMATYDREVLQLIERFKAGIVTKDINANTITHYLATNLKTIKRIRESLQQRYPDAETRVRKVAVVSAIGSDLQVPGLLTRAVGAIADSDITILAMHQSMRQVDMQFIVEEEAYESALCALHRGLIEVESHGPAICAA
jgi:aspartate kinase